MKPFDALPPADWMDDRVEAYLDGALSAEEAARFEAHLLQNEVWEEEMLLAEQVRQGLRALPEPWCPPAVPAAVLATVRQQARQAWWVWLTDGFRQQTALLWRPALAMASLALLVVMASRIGPAPTDASSTTAERAEVQRALAEVQWTLAFVSEVGRETGASVRDDVLAPHIVQPMQHALGVEAAHNP